jgi:hypothetical protein
LKWAKANPAAVYPDFGCSFETFTNNEFLEMETLGPLARVAPGQVAEQVEHWSLHKDAGVHELTDAELDRVVLPLLQAR